MNIIILLCSHFLCVLLDAMLQFSIILLATKHASKDLEAIHILLIQTLYFLPFVLCGSLAGSLSDSFSKTTLFKLYRCIELPLYAFAGYAIKSSSLSLLFPLIFIKGLLTALNSPVKVGILTELSTSQNLSKRNAYFQLIVVIATILGIMLGGEIVKYALSDLVFYLAVLNVCVSIFLYHSSVSDSEKNITFNPIPSPNVIAHAKKNTPLLLANIAIAFFWALATFYKVAVVLFAEKELELLDENMISYLLVSIGLGISVGSLVAARISFGNIEIGLIPIGAAALSLSSFYIAGIADTFFSTIIVLFLVGASSSLFIIPLSSYFQSETDPRYLGSMLALQNQCSYLIIILLSITIPLSVTYGNLGTRSLFFFGGCMTAAIALFLISYIPHMLIRFLNWVLIHTFYKVQIQGKENIPEGGALLIANHISYVDAALIQACLERPVRFLMYKPIYDHFLIHPIVKKLGVIPIEPGNRENVEQALQKAKQYIQNGDLVCIFPEGSISRIGVLLPFKRGMEKIMEGLHEEKIIPIYLDQLWGSIFSFKGGSISLTLPREIPYPVSISFGSALSASTRAEEAYLRLEELGSHVFENRREIYQTLPYHAIKSLRRNIFSRSFFDSSGLTLRSVSFISLVLMLVKKIRPLATSTVVAIHLPNGIGSAAVNLALHCIGKTTANLNGTTGKESIASAFTQTKTSLLITARAYQKKLEITPPEPVTIIYVEDLIARCTTVEKITSHLLACVLPTKLLLRYLGTPSSDPNEIATIIFSSGSTGIPKGVMLSHKNIISNVYSVSQIYETDASDTIMGCLPFFHSFGYTFTFWYPILQQIKVCYHPNPLDAVAIGKLIEIHKATYLFATPTFLQLYLKKCAPEQFKSIKEILVGAEKLSSRLSQFCKDTTGLEPKEGYGCTELSPLALVNSYDYFQSGQKQKGVKAGTVGLPIPGVAAKIVDPNTLEELGHGTEGLLLIKGPNVMRGYLENEALTHEVIKDSWYITGDIALRDNEGFVTITDRLSRFSKIGGEMVPHLKIETLVQEIVGTEERICVVTGIPDEKKGERLGMLVCTPVDIDEVLETLQEMEIPNLWIPKKDAILKVDSLPLLASGKIDLAKTKSMLLNSLGSEK